MRPKVNYLIYKFQWAFRLPLLYRILEGRIYIPGNNWGIRQMIIKNDIIYATVHKEGRVVALRDTDNDNRVDSVDVFADNLSLPHGIELYGDWIYIAQNDKIVRIKDIDGDGKPDSEKKIYWPSPHF